MLQGFAFQFTRASTTVPETETCMAERVKNLFGCQSRRKGVYTDWHSGWFSVCNSTLYINGRGTDSNNPKWFTETTISYVFFSDQGSPFNSEELRDFP